MTWEAMSAAEQDAFRVAVIKHFLPLRREVLQAGMHTNRNPKFGWESDERRREAEFTAMLMEGLK